MEFELLDPVNRLNKICVSPIYCVLKFCNNSSQKPKLRRHLHSFALMNIVKYELRLHTPAEANKYGEEGEQHDGGVRDVRQEDGQLGHV